MNARIVNNNLAEIRMLSLRQSADYMGVGINTARKLGKEIGAIRHYGRRVVLDKNVIDKYLDNLEG